MKAVLAARRRFCFGVLLFLFVGDMHLWDGHVFVVDVFFLPGILLSGYTITLADDTVLK